MAIYRLSKTFIADPLGTADELKMVFDHMLALGVKMTGLKVDTRAVTTGTFDITTNADIPLDQLVHLQITKVG